MAQQSNTWKSLLILFKRTSLCWVEIWKGSYAQLGPECVVKRVHVINGTVRLELSSNSSRIRCPNTPAQAQITISGDMVRQHALTFIEDLCGLSVYALPTEKKLMIGEHCVIVQ